MKTILILFSITCAAAQYTYNGTIIDSDTGERLIGVNVYIEESLEGTATDFNGNFQFTSTEKHPTVKIAYVGYQTIKRRLFTNMVIKLKSEMMTSETVVVVGDMMSPAQRLVLNTIENYTENFKRIENFKLTVYSKTFFNTPKSDSIKTDDDIPMIFESLKDVSWAKPDKIQSVVTKRNQSKSLPASFNLMGALEYQNIFHERFMNFISPLYESHFDLFEYTLGDVVEYKTDSVRIVYAKKIVNEDFMSYRLFIDESNNTLKQVEALYTPPDNTPIYITPFLRTNDAKNLMYIQNYELSEKTTFPSNFIMTRINKSGVIRHIERYQNRSINLDQLNVNFSDQQLVISENVDEIESINWNEVRPQPLTSMEEYSYRATDSIYQTYNPIKKFLFHNGVDLLTFNFNVLDQKTTEFRDFYRFNPVEAHYIGVGFESTLLENTLLEYRIGYATGQSKMFGEVKFETVISNDMGLNFYGEVYNRIKPIGYNDHLSTAYALLQHENPYSYYADNGYKFGLKKIFSNQLSLFLDYQNRQIAGLKNTTEYSWSDRVKYQDNINLNSTQENEVKIGFTYQERSKMDIGTVKIDQLKKDGWDITGDLSLNANDRKLNFKTIRLNATKAYTISNKYLLKWNTTVYKSNQSKELQNAYFPNRVSFFESDQEFAISGFNIYDYVSFDFRSASAMFKMNGFLRSINFAKAGDLSLFVTAFQSHSGYQLNSSFSKELNTRLDFNIGLTNVNSLLVYPLKYAVHYNTFFESTTFQVSWVINM